MLTNGGTTVIWSFSQTVTSISDVSNLIVNGEGGASVISGLGTTSIHVDYPGSHDPGEEWDLDAEDADISFSPPATIADATGTTS